MNIPIPRFDLRGLIRNSLVEWEGRLSAVAVAGGCNWRCPFCHSWRYVTGLADLEERPLDELFSLLDRERGWIDGVVVTGGEPTLQPGLIELLRLLKKRRMPVKLHSNGSRPDVIESLLSEGLLQCLALDCKAPPDARLALASGRPDMASAQWDAVAKSFALSAAAESVEKEYHTTLCPAFVDEGTIKEMAPYLAPGGLWILQNYEPDDVLDAGKAGRGHHLNDALDRMENAARTAYPGGRVLLRRGRGG